MTKHIFLFFTFFALNLYAGVIKKPIFWLDNEVNMAKINVEKVDIGVSGYLVHRLSTDNSSILRNIVVTDFDEKTKVATLQMSEFDLFEQNALPSGNWQPKVGDVAILAFGYSRSLLVAPSEDIYYRVTRAADNVQWVHPDLFATILSFNGHPTPLKEDFIDMSNTLSMGILFIYLHQKLFTLDAKSLTILNITDAPLQYKEAVLPFYSRVEEIDANWFGAGSSELESYAPYYFELLLKNNSNNQELKNLYNQFVKEKKNDD